MYNCHLYVTRWSILLCNKMELQACLFIKPVTYEIFVLVLEVTRTRKKFVLVQSSYAPEEALFMWVGITVGGGVLCFCVQCTIDPVISY